MGCGGKRQDIGNGDFCCRTMQNDLNTDEVQGVVMDVITAVGAGRWGEDGAH